MPRPRITPYQPPVEHTFALPFVLERGQEAPLFNGNVDLPYGNLVVYATPTKLQSLTSGKIVAIGASRADVLLTVHVANRPFTASGPWLLDALKSEMLVPIILRSGDHFEVMIKSLSFEKVITGQVWLRCLFRSQDRQ